MKKLFTLICATFIVLCASAQLAEKRIEKALLADKTPVATELTANFGIDKVQGVKKMFSRTAMSKQRQAAMKQAKKVSIGHVKNATHTITAIEFYSDEYGITLADDAGYYYLFAIKESPYVEGKTYTLADMDAYSTYISTPSWDFYDATAAEVTVTKVNGLIHAEASMTVTNGDVYNITYQEKAFALTGNTIDIVATDLYIDDSYQSWYGLYEYTANTNDYIVVLDIETDTPYGTFTPEMIDLADSHITDKKAGTKVKIHDAGTITVVEDVNGNVALTGKVTGMDGNVYNLNLTYTKPETTKLNISLSNCTLFTKGLTAGFYTIGGTSADKNTSVDLYFISGSLTGTFTEKDMDSYGSYVTLKVDGKTTYYDMKTANFVASIVKDSLVVEGTMLCSNNGKEYEANIHLSTPFTQTWGEWAAFAPFDKSTGKWEYAVMVTSPTTMSDFNVQTRKDNTGLTQFKINNWGAGMFTGEGVELIIDMTPDHVCTILPQFTGYAHSTYGDVYITDYNTATGSTKYPSTYDPETGVFDLVVNYFCNAGSLGSDYETFTMDKFYATRDTVRVDAQNMDLTFSSKYGEYIYTASNDNYDLELWAFTLTSDGTFTTSDGTLDTYSSITGEKKASVTDGSFTVTTTGNTVTLTGEVVCTDEKVYILNLTGKVGGLEYDAAYEDFKAEFGWSNMNSSLKDGVASISAFNDDYQTLDLQLYVPEGSLEIPAGEYTFSSSMEPMTAMASPGVVDGYVKASFACITNEQGQIMTPIWFMETGKVVVSYTEDGKMELSITAKNSYDVNIDITVKNDIITPKAEVNVEASNLTIYDDYLQKYGLYQYIAYDNDYAVVLYGSSEQPYSTFNRNNIDYADSYVENITTGETFALNSGEWTVMVKDKNITLTGWVVAKDSIKYNLNLTGYEGALDYDNNSSDFDATFSREDAEFEAIDANTTLVTAVNGITAVSIAFLTGMDANGNIPAGTYPIDGSGFINTVVPSAGYDNGNISPSYAATVNEALNITNAWYMRSGTVVVDNEGKITVDAVNSYGKKVTVTILASTPTAINSAKVNAKAPMKRIINNRLVIENNGARFNAAGMKME